MILPQTTIWNGTNSSIIGVHPLEMGANYNKGVGSESTMTRLALTAIFGALAAAASFAQTADMPPDIKAYRDIKESDPEKKIAAIEKWKAEFPDSAMRMSADLSVLNTLATKLGTQPERARKFAATMYKGAPEKDKGQAAMYIAAELLNANLLLPDAEKYAKKSVESMVLGKYLQEQMAGYEKRKQDPPPPQILKRRFEASRAARLATLGRIELRLGRLEKGKKLLEESYAGDATSVLVRSELGVLAAQAGDDAKAMDLLIPAKLTGRASKEASEAFESVYRKQHNGSAAGLEAMLDAEYNKRYPSPVKVEPYQPTEKRSERVVLAQVFTGSGCGPCAAADLAFDAAMERYSRKDLAVVMYHVHVPRPDPMTTAETQAIYKSYSVPGVPSFFIDGKRTSGGGTREMAKGVSERLNQEIEKDLETPAEAHITAGATLRGNTVTVNARVFGVKSESKDLKVEIALVEKDLRYNGENGIRFHPMVLRSIRSFELAGERYRHSFDVDAIAKAIKDHLDDYEAKGHRGETFQFTEKKYQIDPAHLAVVVFVNDDKTRHVLQAGYIDLGGETAHPTLEASNVK
jgi:thiol-disulfide isomerase/thioredoxin